VPQNAVIDLESKRRNFARQWWLWKRNQSKSSAEEQHF